MLLHVPQVLGAAEVAQARTILREAAWADGRITAGTQSAEAKRNTQLPEDCDATRAVQQLVLQGLERNSTFFSAALPKHISPPLINRYTAGGANAFGNHVDSAVRYLRNGTGRVRTDISCTLFLSEPAEYEGGELMVEDTFGEHRVKLAAGDMVLYPGTSVHRVEPVTAGERIGSYFWIQSMVRSDEQRRLLFDMDNHLRRLRGAGGPGEGDPSVIGLTSSYHNLLRMWLDV